MDWGTGAALIFSLLAIWVTHRLTLWREQRKEHNSITNRIREMLARERRDGPGNAPSEIDLDRLIMAQHWWRRRACREAVERYKRSKEEIVKEPVFGTGSYVDPAKVHASIDRLMQFTDPR